MQIKADIAVFHLSNGQETRKRAFRIENVVGKQEFLYTVERM